MNGKSKKVKGTAYVRFDIEAQVLLPEGIEFEDDSCTDQLTEECKELATDAATSAFPNSIKIYIYGEGEPPAEVFFDISDSDVTEVRGESD